MAENTKPSSIMNILKTPLKPSDDERAAMLSDLAEHNGEDAAECAAADHFREFPPSP
jgi:hypothetical protein